LKKDQDSSATATADSLSGYCCSLLTNQPISSTQNPSPIYKSTHEVTRTTGIYTSIPLATSSTSSSLLLSATRGPQHCPATTSQHTLHARARARILLQCIFSQANLEREKENTPLKQGTVATIKKLNEIADS